MVKRDAEAPLSPAQFAVLTKLVDAGGTMTAKERLAAGRLNVLRALDRAGYVARSLDKNRPGSFLAWVTDAGAKAYDFTWRYREAASGNRVQNHVKKLRRGKAAAAEVAQIYWSTFEMALVDGYDLEGAHLSARQNAYDTLRGSVDQGLP